MADKPKRRRGVSRKRVGDKKPKKATTRHKPSSKPRGKSLAKTTPSPPTVAEVVQTHITPEHDESVRSVARLLYISGAASIPMIANELNIAPGTVRWWSSKDNWGKLKREVQRFAAKDQVRQVRRAMGRHVKKLDTELSTIMDDMNVLLSGTTLKPVTTQAGALRIKMEAIRLKIALYRAITYGAQGRSMSPHPSTVIFDGTDEEIGGMLANSRIEEILENIPPYITKAVEMVQGLSMDEQVSPEVLDALAVILDKAIPEKDKPKHWHRKEDSDDRTILDAEDDDIDFGFDDDIDLDDDQPTPKKKEEESNEQQAEDPS